MYLRHRYVRLVVVAVAVAVYPRPPLTADSPWASLIPFRRVDANPTKSYELTPEEGPWLILAANFAGENSEQQAQELVQELRSRFKLPAYSFRQTFDFTQPVVGTKLTPYGDVAKMRYNNATKYDGLAVLVGNFRSVDDPDLEKTLNRIRELRPDCLTKSRGASSSNALTELKRRILNASGQGKRGPMGAAFATHNPLLPEEAGAVGGVDQFVERLNKDVEFSLLDNPAPFTVRVASFRGNTTINQREIEEIESSDKVTNKLEVAAEKAHRLTTALRKQGIEAYEFHDRQESLVTIGRFDSESSTMPDGTVVVNPAMSRIIEKYRGSQRPFPGRGGVGFQPVVLAGITFDVEPVPMPVPRRSLGADYARRRLP